MLNLGKISYSVVSKYFISDITDIIMKYMEYVRCQNCKRLTHIYLLLKCIDISEFLCPYCESYARKLKFNRQLKYRDQLYKQRQCDSG